MQIELPNPKALSARAECAALRKALAERPERKVLRFRLARLLIELDAFAEAIELLDPAGLGDLDFEGQLLLASACFARADQGDDRRAATACEAAIGLAQNDIERAAGLAQQGKALLRESSDDRAREVLHKALVLDPRNVDAFKRLVLSLLHVGRFSDALALTAQLEAAGVKHSRLLAAHVAALTGLGRFVEARALQGPPNAVLHRQLGAPGGWHDIAQFCRALEQDLAANTARRFDRFGTASEHTVRIDDPIVDGSPALQALIGAISHAVVEHVDSLGPRDHSWLAARPDRATLRCWCVITGSEGREHWHTHPGGWISGGFYIRVPRAVETGTDRAGCLALGLPPGLAGEAAAAALGEELLRPATGSLILFPSHMYHRTFPHGVDEERICLAFDIRPI